MPYIRFNQQPESVGVGRTSRNVSYKTDTGVDWVAEVDVVLPGETEIVEAAYHATVSANVAYNAAIPPPSPPAPPAPTTEEKLAALIDAIAADKGIDPATAAAVAALKDGA